MSIHVNDLKTSQEADNLVRSLNRAAAYCTGPRSSVQHTERIREVESRRDELRRIEQGKSAK